MQTVIKIPSPLRRYTGELSQVSVPAQTVAQALEQLLAQWPALRPQLLDDQGGLRSFVRIYLDQVDIDERDGLGTRLTDGCQLRIVPAIAGGAGQALSAAELNRYSRHLSLPELGLGGQQKLKAARVLIVGAGGLGSPLCLYLAAAGVGRLGVVDHDCVDESNLQRQVLFGVSDIGHNKAQRAAARLRDLNPHTQVRAYPLALKADNALDILAGYDLVIDGTDNFATRYLVNDACVLLGLPNVYGSIFRFEGQASVFNYRGGPCYRCLYPEPPPPGLVPSCAEGGVLGVLPALVASVQATEAIKILTGIGETLSGRLLLYDALRMQFEELKLRRDPDCALCGDRPSVKALIDYEEFCGLGRGAAPPAWAEISVQELKRRLDGGERPTIIDVREPYEWQICHLEGALHIPLGQLAASLDQFRPDQELILHCKTGGRSSQACQLLHERGFTRLRNLRGGIHAWACEIDIAMPSY